jgi:hypothetical protein
MLRRKSASAIRPSIEVVGADHFGDVQLVILVPALAASALRHAMPRLLAPRAQRILVLPPDEGESFAVFGFE